MSWFSVEPPQSNHQPNGCSRPIQLLSIPTGELVWRAEMRILPGWPSLLVCHRNADFYLTLPGDSVPSDPVYFRFVDQAAGVHHWKSTNVTNFKTPPPPTESASIKYDRRSCKADPISILLDPAQSDRYTVSGKHETRGYPCSGRLVIDGRTIELDGSRAIFVHAIQGMRPNLIASRWNFCNFQSVPEQGEQKKMATRCQSNLDGFTTVPGSSYAPHKLSVSAVSSL
ncbi:hypothetical protein KEM48_009944 [Puccinia striiformis f. sp. tritici PST-130]|nr:hypothetical protein KEM48_009944 [Puccinia striiformis f. sp. tritici PST-130]